jgi:tRNA threonylcarbamoyladenosine biosynthesis protein TsaB
VAQGLAFGAGKPALPVDSLMLVAEDARQQHAAATEVWAAMDARMDEIYAGAYRWEGERWSVSSAAALYSVDALNAVWLAAPPACVAGSAVPVFSGRLALGEARLVPATVSRAKALLNVARSLWADGAAVEAADALPLYLRDKVAQTTAERETTRALKEALP